MVTGTNESLDFLKSALTEENPFNSTNQIHEWIKERNQSTQVKVEMINLSEMDQWYFDKSSGRIRHDTGKFFSIDGIRVSTNWGDVRTWDQPIINQPEIGFLGVLAKKYNGILYFLMQAKIEPGNINQVQISPTLQATKSNYTQAHKGNKPLYLEYFLDPNRLVLLDQLQSEQGGRFLKKRNRNIIILVEEDLEVHENYKWMTLGQIKSLIHRDNIVNMDSRTVISGIPFGDYSSKMVEFLLFNQNGAGVNGRFSGCLLESFLDKEKRLHTFSQIISWFTQIKTQFDLEVEKVPLDKIDKWAIDDTSIKHVDNEFFRVIFTKVEIGNREVKSWTQPLIEPSHQGIIAFICKKINGVLHFLVQAKLECGNHDILEMAPSVQCMTGNYGILMDRIPFLDIILNADPKQIKYDRMQSEEGGRFYREENRNMIVELPEDSDLDCPPNFIWMTLNQMSLFLMFNNYLNIQARSLISAINFRE